MAASLCCFYPLLLSNLSSLLAHLQALIFCAPEPLTAEELSKALAEAYEYALTPAEVDDMVHQLQEQFSDEKFAFQIQVIAGGYQFLTKPEHEAIVAVQLKQRARKRLSAAALETLAIIAYQQPITKGHIEQIRGVNCDYAVQKLLEKELIGIKGKAETPGRPILYGTTQKFMDHFGLNTLKDLPQLKEIGPDEENTIGNPAGEANPVLGGELEMVPVSAS
jgi:segregation and condensation protein B